MKVLPRLQSKGPLKGASRKAGDMVGQAQGTMAGLADEARQRTGKRRGRGKRMVRGKRMIRQKPVAVVAAALAAMALAAAVVTQVIRRKRRGSGRDQAMEMEPDESSDGQRDPEAQRVGA